MKGTPTVADLPGLINERLRQPNSTMCIGVKLAGQTPGGGAGDHYFMMTGYGENVQITHSWQGSHGPRNESVMPTTQFVRDFRTMSDPNAPIPDRQSAMNRVFPLAPASASGVSEIKQVASGVIERPMVQGDFECPGLTPPCNDDAVKRNPAMHQPTFSRQRPTKDPFLARQSAQASNGSGQAPTVDPELEALLRELQAAHGQFSEADLQQFLGIHGTGGASESADHQDEEPQELSDNSVFSA